MRPFWRLPLPASAPTKGPLNSLERETRLARAVDNSMTPFRERLSEFNSFLPDLDCRCVRFVLSTQLPAVAFWAHPTSHRYLPTMLSLSAFS